MDHCEVERQFSEPQDPWIEDIHRPRLPAEPCQIAEGANCVFQDADDKMAADEENRVLEYIIDMCLDRPCPKCRSKVIDKPSDDLRQCRACGELWGFDDTQTMEEFIREFGCMEPCWACGTDGLDDFKIVPGARGKQELICLKCDAVQQYQPTSKQAKNDNFEIAEEPPRNRMGLDAAALNDRTAMNQDDNLLSCPKCPDMTYNFFEKTLENYDLVRAVCPACGSVVFSKTPNARMDAEPVVPIGTANAMPIGELFPSVRKAFKLLAFKPVDLIQRNIGAYAEAVVEGNDPAPRFDNTAAAKQIPQMGEQIGWTVGTTVGNIILKNREGANASATVGAIIGKEICDRFYKRVLRGRRLN